MPTNGSNSGAGVEVHPVPGLELPSPGSEGAGPSLPVAKMMKDNLKT